MQDSESPRTIGEKLYTHCPVPPALFQMDNGCNVHTWLLNREPAHFANMRVVIDEAHFRGHTHCSPNYSTSASLATSLSEQRYSFPAVLYHSKTPSHLRPNHPSFISSRAVQRLDKLAAR